MQKQCFALTLSPYRLTINLSCEAQNESNIKIAENREDYQQKLEKPSPKGELLNMGARLDNVRVCDTAKNGCSCYRSVVNTG